MGLTCPACGTGMKEWTVHGVTLDECTGCYALWFDRSEIDLYFRGERKRDAELEVRQDQFARQQETTPLRPCPRCHTHTLRLGELRDVPYRKCEGCQGILLERKQVSRLVRQGNGWSIAGEVAVETLAYGGELAGGVLEAVLELVGEALFSW